MFRPKNLLRLAGLLVLALLLAKVDRAELLNVMARTAIWLVIAAILLNIPGILVKSFRWRWMLQAQGVRYGLVPSSLAYFGSIFIGMLTPGRLGEFIKALHVSRDCNIPARRAFSSVLADRLFDLYALAIVGGLALIALGSLSTTTLAVTLGALGLFLVLPPVLLLNHRTFAWGQTLGMRMGKIGRRLVGPEGWLVELRAGLTQLHWLRLVQALALTLTAYAVFYTQAYLLALALHLDASVLQVSYAVALGSLVTLLPISISGLGTREAAIVAYLGAANVMPEAALGFSLLVFITFYVGTALIGSVAWFVKPVRLERGDRLSLGDVQRPTA